MKLKDPAVFKLTSICHCNLNGGNRRGWKARQKRKGRLEFKSGNVVRTGEMWRDDDSGR